MTTESDSRKRRPFSWRARGRSFRYAGAGLAFLFAREHNARIHLCAAVLALLLSALLNVSAVEWCLVIVCIATVIALEAVNSAVEALADRITAERSPLIKTAKDVAAAAVLVAAIGSLAIGCIIFIPKLLALL